MIADILLTIAAFGFTFSIIPQLQLLYKIKKSDEVSLERNFIIFICVIMTIIADTIIHAWFATIMNSIQFVLCVVVMLQIWYYRR